MARPSAKAKGKKAATQARSKAGKKTAAKPAAKKKVAPKKSTAKRVAPKKVARRKIATGPSKAKPAKSTGKTIVLYPEAAFGPALNCVGIAQRLKSMGHNPVFVCDRGF